ncbi:MAG: tRNA pseudouridine(55) synthase TruB [Lachnospiraceae bacterium]|nr:tRNA pseudouridine(55) synthase TruB [Lachnospiraceae bacterium]
MDGIINIYKEAGYTSFDVVAKLRGILKERKIGHTGTLDPQATGVLPVCIGKATKLCELMLDKEKTYEAVMLLGVTTDTEDLTGKVLAECISRVTKEDVCLAAEKFTGKYGQVPPMYSALKVDGKRLYELAREGKEIERKPREVEIFENTPIAFETDEEGFVKTVTLRVRCSKGTYIRSLLRDMGDFLGCGACMKSLIRTRAGAFSIETALTLEEVERGRDAGRLTELIQPIDSFLVKYPAVHVVSEFEKYLYNGNQLELKMLSEPVNPKEGDGFRVYDNNGKLIGLYLYRSERRQLQPEKMFLP